MPIPLPAVAMLLLGWTLPPAAPTTTVGYATRVLPRVELMRGRSTAYLREQDTVTENDLIRTRDAGRARVSLDDGSILNIGANSMLTVKAVPQASRAGSLELRYGKLRAVVAAQTASQAFQVRTATAVCGVLGTTLFIDATKKLSHVINISDPDSGSQVRVTSADPKVTGEVILLPGQGTLVPKGKPPGHPHAMPRADVDPLKVSTEF